MDMYENPFMGFPGVTPEEMAFLQSGTADLNDNQRKYFYIVYSSKRKSPQDILIFTIIGFFGVAGIQRFILGDVVLGILYFFTCGFCWIGTIVDLVNNKTLTNDFNRKMAYECYQMARMSS
jgi:TM2 domain-containing membrane protein YozV